MAGMSASQRANLKYPGGRKQTAPPPKKTLYAARAKQTARTVGARVGNRARTAAPRVARSAIRSAPVKRATGGIATFLTLVIGLGVGVAVIRNPKLVTVPLKFLTGVSAGVGAIGRTVAPAPSTTHKIGTVV